MRLSTRIKAMFAMAAAASMIGAVALAQNLEVKGSAWFATGGSGDAGVGTGTPLGKLHVKATGVRGGEDTGGLSLDGDVPIIAQSDGTAIGILNANGRQLLAIDVRNNVATATGRGIIAFSDRGDGVWRDSLVIDRGNVGIGAAPAAGYKLDAAGGIRAAGYLATTGLGGWRNDTYGGGWFMQDTTWVRTVNSKSVWTGSGQLGSDGGLTVGYGGTNPPAAGAIIAGNVGIGASTATDGLGNTYKLHVDGPISAGKSVIYFTNTQHNHVGAINNTAGYASIENAVNYNTLMILGRAGTPQGRRVDVWDYLQVNGRLRSTTGTVVYQVNSSCPNPGTLTTVPSCQYCTGWYCGENANQCCGYGTVSNPAIGRLVDL